jgi:hypothetical protein
MNEFSNKTIGLIARQSNVGPRRYSTRCHNTYKPLWINKRKFDFVLTLRNLRKTFGFGPDLVVLW